MPPSEKEGLGSRLFKGHGKLVGFIGLFGIGLWTFLSKAAVDAVEINPEANILDTGDEFYSVLAETASENLIPGMGIMLSQTFGAAIDFVAPGAGTALNAVTGPLSPAEILYDTNPSF